MEKISSEQKVRQLVKDANIEQYFSTRGLQFLAYNYNKGELITSPDKRTEMIFFVIQGTIRIYGVRKDGTLSPVNQQTAPAILGDLEFASRETSPFFTEAVTDVVCVVLPFKLYEKELHSDLQFLHTLLRSYVEKLQFFAFVDAPAETLEERVLLYLKNFCPEHELCGIEAAVSRLRCSRRQLQRVLRSLCEKNLVEKTGRGRYQLCSAPSSEAEDCT